jgi:L-lactate dehydrogenase
MILRDERAVVPIGSYNPTFGVTLSLPSVVGLTGAVSVLQPDLSGEGAALENGAQSLRIALQAVRR